MITAKRIEEIKKSHLSMDFDHTYDGLTTSEIDDLFEYIEQQNRVISALNSLIDDIHSEIAELSKNEERDFS